MRAHEDVERILSREIGLEEIRSRMYVLIATHGAMDAAGLAGELGVSEAEALEAARALVALGGLIDYGNGRFESMHPRFSIVNMYRKASIARGQEPPRNKSIDNAGAALEKDYDHARAKYGARGGEAQ